MFGRPVVSCHGHKASHIITTRNTAISSLIQQNIITDQGFSTRNTQTTCLESSTVQIPFKESERERERSFKCHSNRERDREERERRARERRARERERERVEREEEGEIVQM